MDAHTLELLEFAELRERLAGYAASSLGKERVRLVETALLGAHGADKLYVWDAEEAHGFVTLPQVEALEAALEASGARTVLFASTNHTKDVAARLAIRADGGVITVGRRTRRYPRH